MNRIPATALKREGPLIDYSKIRSLKVAPNWEEVKPFVGMLSALMEHTGEHPDQQGAIHGVVVLREVPVLGDGGKVEVGGGGPCEHALPPAHVEHQPRHRDARSEHAG